MIQPQISPGLLGAFRLVSGTILNTKNKRGKEPAAVTVFRNLESGIVPSETLPSHTHCNPTASVCGKKSTCDHPYYKQEPGHSEMKWLC